MTEQNSVENAQETAYIALINASLAKQGLATVDVSKPAYILMPYCNSNSFFDPRHFDQAVAKGLFVNVDDPAFTVEAVEAKLSALRENDTQNVDHYMHFPSGDVLGGFANIGSFNGNDFYPEQSKHIADYAKGLKERVTVEMKSADDYWAKRASAPKTAPSL